MLKDIFIDHNIAKNFSNPADSHYKKLIRWLLRYNHHNRQDNAHLVVSNKLLAEYSGTPGLAHSLTNITIIVSKCTREGRINKITNESIKKFKQKYFKKPVAKKLLSNKRDWDHIPVVMLSERKYALTLDRNLLRDINNFPSFSARAALRPQDLPYDQ